MVMADGGDKVSDYSNERCFYIFYKNIMVITVVISLEISTYIISLTLLLEKVHPGLHSPEIQHLDE